MGRHNRGICCGVTRNHTTKALVLSDSVTISMPKGDKYGND